jgi:CDP-diacylglycerol--serine O-phosphatidyltransferase
MKKVYLLPNLFTTASLFCGMLALTHIFQGQLIPACWFILAAAVLDGFDGKIARLTKSESSFGVNYDSLSDLVAFGVAPAALVFSVLSEQGNVQIVSIVSTLFAVCGALRLARFNVQRTREEKRTFTGLPIPAAACTVIAAYLVYHRINPGQEWPGKVLLFLVVILSGLMVSNIPYPSHKNLGFERRKSFDYLVSIVLVFCIVLSMVEYLEYVLFLCFLAYVTYGLARHLLKLWQRFFPRETDDDEAESEPLPIER